jgi:hypothetical protein
MSWAKTPQRSGLVNRMGCRPVEPPHEFLILLNIRSQSRRMMGGPRDAAAEQSAALGVLWLRLIIL